MNMLLLSKIQKSIRAFSIVNMLLLLAFPFSSVIQPALAADFSPQIIVSPYNQVISVSRGDQKVMEFTIKNNSNTDIVLKTSFTDFKAPSDDSGTPVYFTNLDKNLISVYPDSWFSAQSNVSIAKNTLSKVFVTVTVPLNATAGGHYGGVEFQATPVIPDQTSNLPSVKIVGKIAIPILIGVNGLIKENLSVDTFGFNYPFLSVLTLPNGGETCFGITSCIASASVNIRNDGNLHESPKGKLTILDTFGNSVYSTQFNTEQGYILPFSNRSFSIPVNVAEFGGIKTGYYTAQLNFSYGTNNSQITVDSKFFLIDWSVILLILILIALCVGLYVYRKETKKIGNRTI